MPGNRGEAHFVGLPRAIGADVPEARDKENEKRPAEEFGDNAPLQLYTVRKAVKTPDGKALKAGLHAVSFGDSIIPIKTLLKDFSTPFMRLSLIMWLIGAVRDKIHKDETEAGDIARATPWKTGKILKLLAFFAFQFFDPTEHAASETQETLLQSAADLEETLRVEEPAKKKKKARDSVLD